MSLGSLLNMTDFAPGIAGPSNIMQMMDCLDSDRYLGLVPKFGLSNVFQ